MAETTKDQGERPAQPASENRKFGDILKSLAGQTVTIVNPESYEQVPLGFEVRTGFYRAKVTAVGIDFVALATDFVRKGKNAGKEPVKQFLPLSRIKRISVMKSERFIHL
ncbi:MAG: hypothetical protein O7E54_05885 [Planctomycetota bacterium]|nr:hypothetical protein [Planctomycetota bacterium]